MYHRFLREPLRARDAERMRAAFIRWIKVAIVWQAAVLVACAVYLFASGSRPGSGFAWISPAVGAILGTALPLQLVAFAALRSGRG